MRRVASLILLGISFLIPSKGACCPSIISAVLERPCLTDRIQGTSMTFTRDSTAYTFDGDCVSNGEPRFQKMAIFNRPEYTLLDPYSQENIVALAHFDGYFWGAKPWITNPTGNSLYRSIDAKNWEPMATLTTLGVIKSLYVTQAGLLLVGTQGSPGRVFVWDNQTESLLEVLTMLSRDPYPYHWSWAEMDGVIYVGEYGNKYLPNNSRRIYRSLDGGWNWEVLYDPPEMDGYHVHKVLTDPYRSHIYWSHGDNITDGSGSQLFRSADGGQTWDILSNTEQPTSGIARPDGAYFGADSGGVGIYRFLDGSERGEFVCTNLVKGYVYDMQEYNAIYATSVVYGYDGSPSVITSRDGEHWGNLYQWQTGFYGVVRFVCEDDGIVYGIMNNGAQGVSTMSFPEPAVRTSWGVVVEPATQNLLDNPCYSSFEGCMQNFWKVYLDTVAEISSEHAHSGNNSLKVSNTGDSKTMKIRWPNIYGNYPAGTIVSATAGVGRCNEAQRIYMRIIDKTNGQISTYNNKRTWDNWSELTVYWQLPLDSSSLCIEISICSATPETVFYIDSVALAVNQVPISFHIGGEHRAAETLSHHVAFPSCWTDIFCWQPPYSPSVVDQTKVIKSWSAEDGSSWLQLVLDNANNLKLEEANGVSTKTLASMSVPDFLPDSLIRFAVVQEANEIELHTLCPQGWLLANGERTEVCPTTVFFGSTPEGTMQAGGIYSNARVYNANMTSEEIVQVINEIAEMGPRFGDLDGDGDVTFSDLFALAENWLRDDCSYPDWCNHADEDKSGTVDFSDFANFAEFWLNWCK